MTNTLNVELDRDSVAAGDDVDPHNETVEFPASATIAEALTAIRERRYLASIFGGMATWIIDIGSKNSRSIGVLAQQWPDAKLLIPADTRLSDLFKTHEPRIHFRYWTQVDPHLVYDAIKNGTPLPSRYW